MSTKNKLVSALSVDCYGIAMGDMGNNADFGSIPFLFDPKVLAENNSDFDEIKSVSAQIQHFVNGDTRVLCPYMDNKSGECHKNDGKIINTRLEEISKTLNIEITAIFGPVYCPYNINPDARNNINEMNPDKY